MEKTTLIVPCYNEEENIAPFYVAAADAFKDLSYTLEIIFVDDGSTDGTCAAINRLKPRYNINLRCVSFSRNFGKEAAIYAGLQRSTGDFTVIIDADLQQDPHLVPAMLEIMETDPECDSVVYYQENRKESAVLKLCKHMFYHVINRVSDIEFKAAASDFRMIRRNVLEAVLSMPEVERFSKGIFEWVGFNKTYLPYTPAERLNGTSKWTFLSLLKYAFSGITSFSTKPLKAALKAGIVIAAAGIAALIISLVYPAAAGTGLTGNAFVAGLILLIGGLQIAFMGIFGHYFIDLSKEVKKRPVYIVRVDRRISNIALAKMDSGKDTDKNEKLIYKIL